MKQRQTKSLRTLDYQVSTLFEVSVKLRSNGLDTNDLQKSHRGSYQSRPCPPSHSPYPQAVCAGCRAPNCGAISNLLRAVSILNRHRPGIYNYALAGKVEIPDLLH